MCVLSVENHAKQHQLLTIDWSWRAESSILGKYFIRSRRRLVVAYIGIPLDIGRCPSRHRPCVHILYVVFSRVFNCIL
jgi:hypothetical protein